MTGIHTVDEIAELLRTSPNSVYRLIRRTIDGEPGGIAFTLVGARRYVITDEQLAEFLARQAVEPADAEPARRMTTAGGQPITPKVNGADHARPAVDPSTTTPPAAGRARSRKASS